MSEKKSKNVVIIALCITLIFMGVGFAALSQTLQINGTATVTGSWDVKITNIEAVEAVYAHTAVTGAANLANFATVGTVADKTGNVHGVVNGFTGGGTNATFNVDLNEPGDYVIYKVTVTNGGSIVAKLATTNGITLTDNSPEVFSDGNGGTTFEGTAGEGQKLFIYTMQTESSGVYSVASDLGTLASGMGTLTATGTANSVDYFYVKVLYNNTALEGIPDSTHNSAIGTLTLNYIQNDNAS